MSGFIEYDWLEQTDWSPLTECLKHSKEVKDDLSDILWIDYGNIVFRNESGQDFSFMPLSMCKFVAWLVQNYLTLVESFPIFLVACEENIIFDLKGSTIHMFAVTHSISAEWHSVLGESISDTIYHKGLVSSHKLFLPLESHSQRTQLPGNVERDFSMKLRDWILGIYNIGSQFQSLVRQSKPLLRENVENCQYSYD